VFFDFCLVSGHDKVSLCIYAFLEFIEILKPILTQFAPEFIIVAAGFDMHYDDPIGNNLLTSKSYYNFTHNILKIAEFLINHEGAVL